MEIPTKRVSSAAAFHPEFDAVILRKNGLDQLIRNVRAFFAKFRDVDIKSTSEKRVQDALTAHNLTIEKLVSVYYERPTTA